MKHKVGGKRLSRDKKERKALYKNLACAFFLHDEIVTTETKAKAVKSLLEKMISRAKDGSLHSRRLIDGILQNSEITNRLVDVIAPLFKNKNGGYVRIVRLWPRRGDNSMMARIELVEKPVVAQETTEVLKGTKEIKGTKGVKEIKGAKEIKGTKGVKEIKKGKKIEK